jgi:hypothetical protein
MTIKRAHSDKRDAGGSISSQSDQFVMEPSGVKVVLATKLPDFLV